MERFDAVVPVVPRDFERLTQLLIPSLLKYFSPLGTLWVVTPQRHFSRVRELCRGFASVRVVPEEAFVPELALLEGNWLRLALTATGQLSTRRIRNPGLVRSGWYKQQLVKLAAAKYVESPWYLVLDADVLAVREPGPGQLVKSGRVLGQLDKSGNREIWLEWAARALDLPKATLLLEVTPTILSTEATLGMLDRLAGLPVAGFRGLMEAAASFGSSQQLGTWATRLMWELPWTEYGLYSTYAEANGGLRRWHWFDDEFSLSGNNCWSETDFDSWDPQLSFGSGDGCSLFFTVIQSNKGIPASVVRARVAKWL